MRRVDTSRVLAIGLDAAELTLVERLLADGELPHLRALLADGAFRKVTAPQHIGTSTVWPARASQPHTLRNPLPAWITDSGSGRGLSCVPPDCAAIVNR